MSLQSDFSLAGMCTLLQIDLDCASHFWNLTIFDPRLRALSIYSFSLFLQILLNVKRYIAKASLIYLLD